VKPVEDSAYGERDPARFLEDVHEQSGGDEDEVDVQIGHRPFGDVSRRQPDAASQPTPDRGQQHRQLGGKPERLGRNVHDDHDAKDQPGEGEHGHRSAP